MAKPKQKYTILYLWTFLLAVSALDDCDWLGSGSSPTHHVQPSSTGVVIPVYLRPGCGSGRVTWLYPKGALRIVLKRPRTANFGSRYQNQDKSGEDYGDFRWPYNDVITPSSVTTQKIDQEPSRYGGREFKVCILVHNMGEDGSLDKTPSERDKKINFPARLFLEGPRSLVSLYSGEDGGASSVRCFRSKNGIAAIYVEADAVAAPSRDLTQWRPQAVIDYDIQLLESDNWEQCKPCTKAELMQAFCTSDTVVRGRVTGVQHVDAFDSARVTVKVTRHVRHHSSAVNSSSFGASRLLLHASKRCSFEQSFEELVFMARLRLTHLTLTCATTLKQWAEILHEQQEKGDAPCLLEA